MKCTRWVNLHLVAACHEFITNVTDCSGRLVHFLGAAA